MTTQTTDRQLLSRAIEQVNRQTGLRLYALDEAVEMGGQPLDAIIEIEGYPALRFVAWQKKWAQQANLGMLVEQVRQLPGKGMLVADYVNPNMADRLREMNVPYIDTAGNACIDEKPLHIFIKGNRPAVPPARGPRGRAFKPGGLKIVHALFTQPHLLDASYRDIATSAGVALGTVGQVLQDMKQAGFLVEAEKKQRRLQQRKRLFNRWVEAYLESLKPGLLLGRYTTDRVDWWKAIDITKYGAVWGGEVAVAKTTRYMNPENITVYLAQGGAQLMADARLRTDDAGEVALYRQFWQTTATDETGVADAMVVYADLVGSVDPGAYEVARTFYGEQVDELIGQD
jgi:hypothetical protein